MGEDITEEVRDRLEDGSTTDSDVSGDSSDDPLLTLDGGEA